MRLGDPDVDGAARARARHPRPWLLPLRLCHALAPPDRDRHWVVRARCGPTALTQAVVQRFGPGDALVELRPGRPPAPSIPACLPRCASVPCASSAAASAPTGSSPRSATPPPTWPRTLPPSTTSAG